MWVRSLGSLVTTGAWWRSAVATTMASTTSAVPEAAQATPAARPVRSSSGRMSRAFSTREIWCSGALPGGFGERAVPGLVLGHQFAGSGPARRVLGGGAGFFGGGFGEPGRHRLALFGSGGLDGLLHLSGDGDRQLPYGHAPIIARW